MYEGYLIAERSRGGSWPLSWANEDEGSSSGDVASDLVLRWAEASRSLEPLPDAEAESALDPAPTRSSIERFRMALALVIELTRFSWYGPHFCDALACLYVGLWWPLASNDSRASEFVVLARRR